MNENAQNACLMHTTVDEETGEVTLAYIPLRITEPLWAEIFNNSTCDNRRAFIFELLKNPEEYWRGMWKDLEGMCDVDK